ncbi:MAG: radical SAM protein [Elusimicrobiota bacterium]
MSCNVSDLLRYQSDGPAVELFDAHAVRDAWQEHRSSSTPAPRHFYLHIPFCRQRCSYCCYYSVASAGANQVDEYLDWLEQATAFFAPTFARRPFQTLYIGGGTPSLLTPEQLRRLLSNLFDRFKFDANGQKTVEGNPSSVTREKLDILHRFGVNRISMGVQSLNRAPLASENRGYQEPSVVERAVGLIREAGDFDLNLDLLIGMRSDDGRSFLNSFDNVARLDPDEITVYTISPQQGYLDRYYSGKPDRFRAHLVERFGEVPRSIRSKSLGRRRSAQREPSLEDHAWHFSGGTHALRKRYDDFSPEPASVFGLGPSSRSRVAGGLNYAEETRLPALFDPRRPSYRGRRLTMRDEMVKYLVVQICKGGAGISPKDFLRLFGMKIEAAFPREIEALRQDGLLAASGDRLEFRIRGAEDRARCAARFAAPPGLTLETAFGRWRLNVEPRRDKIAYLAQTAALGLRVAEDGSPWPRPEDAPRISRIVAVLFLKAAKDAPASAVKDVERDYSALLSDVAPRLRAVLRHN